jgi:cytochrome c-type biogenesis protein CcmH
MALWFVLTMMTAAAIFAVLWPLARHRAATPGGSDIAVYRDQLDEIARDRAAGLIGEAEAEAARVEVSRRLIAAADAAPKGSSLRASTSFRRAIALAALIILPLGAGALYLAFGSPQIPAQPLAARLSVPAAQRSIESMVAQIEAHLEKNPNDGRGWEVVAPVYYRLGRVEDAVKARQNALRLLGDSAERYSDLGEAVAAAANGIVTADAKAAFEKSLRLESGEPKASYYLGLAAEQDGKLEDAARIWRELLGRTPDAPWTPLVQQALARVSGTSPPGPTQDDVSAASQLSPEQRSEMVHGMVARLVERLKSDGQDIEGWLRLVRAYMVLGERDQARSAATDARRALDGDREKLMRLEGFLKEFGLEG